MTKHTAAYAFLRSALPSIARGAPGTAAFAQGEASSAKPKEAAPISTEDLTFGRQGEAIRFGVRKKGKVLHEMVIGTMAELKSHGEMMRQHPGMAHDEGYMTHVGAGKKGEMLWQFTEAGEFHYACLIPDQVAAGMVGNITVTKG